jgi:hypothetical protein
MLIEMLKFGVTAFKCGKQLEGIIDETADKFREQAKMAEGQPKPLPPEVQKMQMQAQLEQAKLQSQEKLKQMEFEFQVQAERAKQEYQSQETQVRMQMEMERDAAEREMELKVEQMKMLTQRNTQVLLAHINNGAKIETARISAGTDDGAQAYYMEEDMAHAMEHPMQPIANAIQQGNQQTMEMIGHLIGTLKDQHEQANRPKTVLRGPDGKIVGVQ